VRGIGKMSAVAVAFGCYSDGADALALVLECGEDIEKKWIQGSAFGNPGAVEAEGFEGFTASVVEAVVVESG